MLSRLLYIKWWIYEEIILFFKKVFWVRDSAVIRAIALHVPNPSGSPSPTSSDP